LIAERKSIRTKRESPRAFERRKEAWDMAKLFGGRDNHKRLGDMDVDC